MNEVSTQTEFRPCPIWCRTAPKRHTWEIREGRPQRDHDGPTFGHVHVGGTERLTNEGWRLFVDIDVELNPWDRPTDAARARLLASDLLRAAEFVEALTGRDAD